MRRFRSAGLGFCGCATAVAAICSPVAADFSYPDFSSSAGLQLNGATAAAGSALRLSTASVFSSGSAFTTFPISLGAGNSFSTYFQFQISSVPNTFGDGDGPGADGLVFVLQTVSNSVGGAGGGIGYQGINPSVGVEFDTYDNGPFGNDPDGNHVGVDASGNIASVATAVEPVRFNDGQTWNAWIDYDGTLDALEVRWSQSTMRPVDSQLSYVADLAAILGQNTAFIGFTSATGSGFGDHDILNWTFRGEFAPIPEPAALALAIGAIALAYAVRR